MPIMAVQDQNDVRGSTRVLARAAKRYIDAVPDDQRHVPALNGVFRLLKAYKVNELQGYEYQHPMERGPDAVSMLPVANGHVGDLRIALKEALEGVSGEDGRDRTIDSIQQVLRNIVIKSPDIDSEGRLMVSRFLELLLERLRVVG